MMFLLNSNDAFSYQPLVDVKPDGSRDGAEAIDLYRRYCREIDVALLDIGLPKVAGWDVILKLKEENPNVNVLVASGYIEPEFKAYMYKTGVQGFIYKPYVPEKVVQMLKDVMARSENSQGQARQV